MLPVLITARLKLDPLTESDVDTLWAMLIDPAVRRFMCDDVILPRSFAVDTVTANTGLAGEGLGLRAIRVAGDFAGIVGLKPVSAVMAGFIPAFADDVELTIAMAPHRWGRGLAAESVAAVLAERFRARPGRRITAVTDEPNRRSRGLLEHLGFRFFGSFPGVAYISRAYTLEPP